MMKKLDPFKNKLLICVGLVLGLHSYAQIPYSHYYTDAQEALDRKDTINAIKAFEKSINEEHFELSKPMLALVYENQKRYKDAYSLFLSYTSASEHPVWSHMGMLAGSRIKVAEYKLEGRGTEKDTLGAVKWLNEALDIDVRGIAHAILGYCYLKGGAAIKNDKKAFECYKFAAENFNNWHGKMALATCYIEGIGCKQDFSQAYSILEDSVMIKDDVRVQLLLGIAYYKDSSLDNHYQKAVEWLSLVANNNWSEEHAAAAKYWLAKCYRFGYGVSRDAEKADELTHQAMEYGSEEMLSARNLLTRAWLYLYRGDSYSRMHNFYISGIKRAQTSEYSEKLARKAQGGNLWAKYELAQCYYFGWGVQKDKEKAKILYQQVIDLGKNKKYHLIVESAHYRLFLYPNSKESIPSSSWGGAEWNDDWSQYYVGVSCLLGDWGREKNVSESIFWLERAAEQGFSAAQLLLGDIYYNKQNLNYNLRKSIKYYEEAAANKNSRAMFSLGHIYYYDKVMRDVQKAHYWIEKAIQLLEVETEYPPATLPYKLLCLHQQTQTRR